MLVMAREWGMTPWQVEAELEVDATRDLWVERWRLFVEAEAERMTPPEPKTPGRRRIT